jgi:hypothetical protein
MKPEPLWRRIQRRPSWERNDPWRYSDFDPSLPIRAAVRAADRLTLRMQASVERMAAMLDRLERR